MLGLLHGLQQHCTARPIVQVRPHDPISVAGQGTGEGSGVPYHDHGLGFLPIPCADVDIEIGQLELLLLFALLHGDDPHGAILEPHHSLIQRLGFQPADGPEAQEAVLLDVGDDDAHAVHVSSQHDLFARPLLVDDQVAQGVLGDVIGVRLRCLADGGADGALVPGHAVGTGQGFQSFLHICQLSSAMFPMNARASSNIPSMSATAATLVGACR